MLQLAVQELVGAYWLVVQQSVWVWPQLYPQLVEPQVVLSVWVWPQLVQPQLVEPQVVLSLVLVLVALPVAVVEQPVLALALAVGFELVVAKAWVAFAVPLELVPPESFILTSYI